MSAPRFRVACADNGEDPECEYETWEEAEHWRLELDSEDCAPHRVQCWVEVAEWQDVVGEGSEHQ